MHEQQIKEIAKQLYALSKNYSGHLKRQIQLGHIMELHTEILTLIAKNDSNNMISDNMPLTIVACDQIKRDLTKRGIILVSGDKEWKIN